MIYIAIGIVIAILTGKIIYDYRLWLAKKPVNHLLEWLIMAAASAPAIYIFTIESSLSWYLAAGISAGMIAWFIWTFFDGIYNKLRGYGFFFTGSNDPDDAKTDNFLQSLPKWAIVAVKLVPLAGLIAAYIFLL